ncbi:MAG: formylglycine-generating enzyme family protein, partial [Proteobacteria bacterium]|nr:formylglycine-generating enzyme family protein [Pseudomonadota bacterium]
GVGKIVHGSVGNVGKTYYLTMQWIDVKTGKVELSAEDVCRCEIDNLLGSTMTLAKKLLGEKVEQPETTESKQGTVTVDEPEQKTTNSIGMTKVERPAATESKLAVAAKPSELEPKITNSIGMTFVYIKPGTFMMGSPAGELGRDSDETQHQVTLTRGFYMQTTEVTQGQWQSIMGSNPSYFKDCGGDCPVEKVSWNDAQEFIRRLNQKEGGNNYRLPTEAEWEYAARAGSEAAFSGGGITKTDCAHDPVLNALGWYCGNADKKTHPVAQKNSNSWGLYDMHGNVWEWVQDWKGDYQSGYVTDPTGPSSGSYRVDRGGSWIDDARYCRSADRNEFTPADRDSYLGFRLSRTY